MTPELNINFISDFRESYKIDHIMYKTVWVYTEVRVIITEFGVLANLSLFEKNKGIINGEKYNLTHHHVVLNPSADFSQWKTVRYILSDLITQISVTSE